MKFQLNRKKAVIKMIISLVVLLCLEYAILPATLSLLIPMFIGIGVSHIYMSLKKYSEVYIITNDTLVMEKAELEIPLSEIHEIVRRYSPMLKCLDIFGIGFGYQYFLTFEGYDYELMKDHVNNEGESINTVLHQKFEKEYRDVKKLKLAVKIKKEDESFKL